MAKKKQIYIFSSVLFLIFVLMFRVLSSKESRNYEEKIFSEYEDYIFGIDISHYQGTIQWDSVKNLPFDKEISFVYIRATAGSDTEDKQFKTNWEQAKNRKIIRGAYHYYRPDENSLQQAQNFINTVSLKKGDLPPVLDIEKQATVQSMKKLKKGLKKWLLKIEKHYGMQPIIYTPDVYYRNFLSDTSFHNYRFWIANYNKILAPAHNAQWTFWQFSQRGKISGINHDVDFNVFRGTLSDLKKLTKK